MACGFDYELIDGPTFQGEHDFVAVSTAICEDGDLGGQTFGV